MLASFYCDQWTLLCAGRPRNPLHLGETRGNGLEWRGGRRLMSPGSSSSKLWAKVFPNVPAGSAGRACSQPARTGLACSTPGWPLQLPWTSADCLSGHSEISTRAPGIIRIAPVRSLAYKLTDLPWGCFSKQKTLAKSSSCSCGFLRDYFKQNSAYRLALSQESKM